MRRASGLLIAMLSVFVVPSLLGQTKTKEVIPHAQTSVPGPALSPQEALKKMQVPPGFTVELVAAEPDVVNPVAMTIDERGRFWITESLEYPKRAAGPGKDRVKILEDTDGDGKADKFTVVIEGLNIPSGIAVGHGGVWVANSPDILFYPFLDRDNLRLAKPQVVATGFGRQDTHELPNSLTWGPDGWLYGLNGVFNPSVVKSNNGKEYRFTCALFRIHPRTREFQVWCEGTSNPWGVAFDTEGSAFVSACVIDHLWHLVETGYYHRQGGPYPPFTWKIESIVKHKHQKAAYCGLTFFDSDAYPPEYREKLYMGNIHGNAINCDELTRDGSTYFARPALSAKPQAAAVGVGEGSNFLLANDVWFMPVVQKTGPDGCLYILDWYDRYHCYQDANRDPAGIDRLRGRLYRVRYKDTPRAPKFDLAKEEDAKLIERLHSANIYYRNEAQRILTERFMPGAGQVKDALNRRTPLIRLLRDERAPSRARQHALWTVASTIDEDVYTIDMLLHSKAHQDRAFAIRVLPHTPTVQSRGNLVPTLADDPSPDVRLQVAIAATKLKGVDPVPVLLDVLAHSGNDKLIPHIVWQNLHPLLETQPDAFLRALNGVDLQKATNVADLMPRAVDRLLAVRDLPPQTVSGLVLSLAGPKGNEATCGKCLAMLTAKAHSGELSAGRREEVAKELLPTLHKLAQNKNFDVAIEATVLAASLGDAGSIGDARRILTTTHHLEGHRLKALAALVAIGDDEVLEAVAGLLVQPNAGSADFRGQMLLSLGKLDDPKVAALVLKNYAALEPGVQPKAIDLLTQRSRWSKALLEEIATKKLPASVLNVNQVRKLLASKDAELVKQVAKVWGTVRDGRNPQREQLVSDMRSMLQKTPGDAKAGRLHFNKICAQCHKLHGEGQEVGPDITSNGRGDFEQLLSNVFDPSLVIGAGYHATTVITASGQSLAGLLVEDSPQRLVLKTQGGKIETIARGDVDQILASKVSYMPEDVEKQLRPQEIADLFAFLCLDRPPEDPKARKIPGTPR
jgi:putative membrane-bound dehydrogenase-like protein